MAIVMVAMLAFGGTYAYFTAQGPTLASGSISTATVQLGAGTTVEWVDGNVVSGQSVIATENFAGFSVTNESTVDTYIFLTFSATFAPRDGLTAEEKAKVDEVTETEYAAAGEGAWYLDYELKTTDNSGKWTALTGQYKETAQGEAKTVSGVYYYKANAKNGTAESIEVFDDIKFFGKSASSTTTQGVLMGGSITVNMDIRSIQLIDEGTGADFTSELAAYIALNGYVAA